MNKKTIGLIAVLAILVIAIFLNPFGKDTETIEDPIIGTIKTEEELNKEAEELPELTDEQKETFDSIVGETGSEGLQKIEIVSTPDDQDLESESPTLVYKDENGNEIAEEIDIDEWNMTDEEAEDDMKRITEEMNQMMKDYAKNKEAHDNGEEVSLPAVEEKDYEPTFESGNDDKTYDPYEGYGSYKAYLNAARELFPDMSEEELRSRFPDKANARIGHEQAEREAAEGLLGGS